MALQRRRLHGVDVAAAILSLVLTSGCALFRGSNATVPRAPSRGSADVADKREAAHHAEGKINDPLKRLEHNAQGSPRSAGAADRTVTQTGRGTEHAAGTTGVAPELLRSSGSSSVVITQPGGAMDPGGTSSPGTAAGSSGTAAGIAKTGLALATGGLVAGFVLVACCLIAAILWLPRRLKSR
jgi:hypothetical protein